MRGTQGRRAGGGAARGGGFDENITPGSCNGVRMTEGGTQQLAARLNNERRVELSGEAQTGRDRKRWS